MLVPEEEGGAVLDGMKSDGTQETDKHKYHEEHSFFFTLIRLLNSTSISSDMSLVGEWANFSFMYSKQPM